MEDSSLVTARWPRESRPSFQNAEAAEPSEANDNMMEDATGPTPFQGKAIAESPMSPRGRYATRSEDAVGVRLCDLPLTSEKIYAALNGKK